MEITTNQNKAVNEIVELIATKIGNEKREVDPIEAISTTARLAGSFMFRSFNFEINDPKPGSVILSENANVKGPELVNITYGMLNNFGITVDSEKVQNGAQDASKISFVDAINLVQNEALDIMKKYDLSYEKLAQSAAIATAFMIQQSKNIVSETGFGTAIYYYIEGSKTYPPEFSAKYESGKPSQNTTTSEEKKPWWKIW